jgi:hypothetical protein
MSLKVSNIGHTTARIDRSLYGSSKKAKYAGYVYA